MRHEFGGQPAHALARERTSKTERRGPDRSSATCARRLVHWQHEPVAGEAAFVAERLAQRFPERQRAILDGVMLIDLQSPCN